MKKLHGRTDMDRAGAAEFLGCILDDEQLPEGRIAEALTLLTDKTVTVDEVCGFVEAMRARMTRLPYQGEAVDTCGTGGDKSGTFNVSTAAAIVLAAGGVNVAKHGNRAATSKCGSADVLEALGIPVDLGPEDAAKYLEEHGFVFLFAPQYHPILKRLITVRKQLGFPTVFNLLGPLLNPAGVRRQAIGTFSLANAELLAQVMAKIGNYEQAIVLTSDDGLDEASLAAPVTIFEIKGSEVTKRRIQATDYGLESAPVSELQGGDPAENAGIITAALRPAGAPGPQQCVIIFNAGIGFYVSGKGASIEEGVDMARAVLSDGRAERKLQELTA
jgi:anthranilate phosphoribosyltransferase